MKEQRSSRLYYSLQLFAAILGLGISLYLFVQHTRLKLGIQEKASFCTLSAHIDCDVVNSGDYSEVFGIPIAALGALYSFILLLGTALFLRKDKNFNLIQKALACFAVIPILIDFIILAPIQFFFIKAICLMCFLFYFSTLLHLFCNFRLARLNKTSGDKSFIAFFFDFPKPQLEFNSKTKIGFGLGATVLFTALLFLIPYFIRSQAASYHLVDNAIEKAIEDWKEKPIRRFEVLDSNGTFGNPNSKIQIVEFSDFECPFCRRTAFSLHTLLNSMEKRVHFVFKNFPLDMSCNRNLSYQIHAHACKLARLVSCAAKSGNFWNVHDQLFLKMPEDLIKEGFDAVIKNLSPVMSSESIQSCLSNPKSLEDVQNDIQLATELKVQATPTIYINGKEVTIPKTPENFRRLIEIEEQLVK